MGTLHPWERRIFIDTEFTDIAAPRLISVAMVAEDGPEFYAEQAHVDRSACSAFVRASVLPLLGADPTQVMERAALRDAVRIWMSMFTGLKQRPVICYDHPVDLQLLWELLGGRTAGWKVKLINSRIDPVAKDEYFRVHGGRHHALHDARANRAAYG
ncbi:3'-5' exoribonuclease [Burkholderia sp. Se-20378]|uniref:3'-5' exoribonuclease n=1 Tax=Burkholderia sp. Se-20378 TaxID=2703899 RepID=UPI0019816D04|nr:3'-5' exoribonuclease [Burkholderia sp. Se-20378]MBN3769794.1 3'-5' exoribonuclease [Burkholderia sp. Se-20378]